MDSLSDRDIEWLLSLEEKGIAKLIRSLAKEVQEWRDNHKHPKKELPCSFCGEDGMLMPRPVGDNWRVECDACGARGSSKPTSHEAIRAWNRAFR